MENEQQLVEKYNKMLKNSAIKALNITTVNHKPDIFCISPEHFPKDGSMFIKPEQAPCYNCKQPVENHTYDTVLFLKLTEDIELDRAQELLKSLPLIEDKIDGVVFVETKEKYRIV